MNEIFENLYDMTAFSNIIAEPQFLIMYAIAFVLLYLGIKKQYEPLLLVPIAFGVLLANFPGGDMGVIQADENGMVMVNGVLKNIWEMPLHDIAHELGIMNFIYYMLIKTGFLPPIIFMGVGALTDFGPMLRNLHLSIFGAAAQLGIFTVLLVAILMGFTPQEAASLGIIGGADGPTADTEIIDQIGRPIGASDTAGGVTVTADAILFDGYNYLISYTLEKEDGSAFDCTKNPDTGLYDLYWKRSDSTIGRGVDGASGSSYFYDENPSDNAIQYVETMSYNDTVQTGGTVKITLGDLCVLNSENGEPTTIAKGAWRLKFQLEAGNSAVELPAGQNIDVNGRSAAVDTIVISPIGYHVVYTVDGEATFDTLYDENGEEIPQESGREPASVSSTWESYSAKLLVTKTDGTVLDFSDCGGSMDPHDGNTVCTRQGTFDTILPLDELASVTIGDITIPVK